MPASRLGMARTRIRRYADSASRGQPRAAAIRARGGVPRVAVTSMWGQEECETLALREAWNAPIQRVRARIEKIFGTWKGG